MRATSVDHIVLTVRDVDATVAFYELLGLRRVMFGNGRVALAFGEQKLNLHEHGREFEPKAVHPTPGSADMCFLLATPLDEACAELDEAGIAVELGPVERDGAQGPIRSVYVRDPDGNLVELAEPLP